jgi:hypothetical protein
MAHVEKTLDHKVLFTCEDNHLDHPVWQSKKELDEGDVNIVHFWHDLGFSTAMMSAHWKDNDGSIQRVHKQQLAL